MNFSKRFSKHHMKPGRRIFASRPFILSLLILPCLLFTAFCCAPQQPANDAGNDLNSDVKVDINALAKDIEKDKKSETSAGISGDDRFCLG